MRNIQIHSNKTLKLTNVLIFPIELEEIGDIGLIIVEMENYIKTKGALPIGPIIQKSIYTVNENGQLVISAYLLRQTDRYIHKTDAPYSMESVIRVKNCMYAHYIGPEEKIKFAYDKINVTAFEEDIELSNENYTIFVDQQDDNIVADVFVEKKSNE
jgi:hypothetical protein